jgi:serine protease Do
MTLTTALLAAALAVTPDALPAAPAPAPAPATPVSGLTPPAAPYCSGEYADDMLALAPDARRVDQGQEPFTYCLRSAAVYECPSYRSDGTLRRTRKRVVSHGTGFGLRRQDGKTLLVTNDHVAEWPAVADDEHPVDGVPAGCRKVSSTVKVVDDEADAYEKDDVAAALVVSDPELDATVLEAKAELQVIPWKFGRSAGLRERNVVDVRGFPLGALRAHNVGKVISTHRHDDDNGWDHDDFVVDALLSPGNSGSPVLAVSCRTGEFELVGLYHARYTRGSALHTVVGIDQLHDLFTSLKRAPKKARDGSPGLDAASRARLADEARAAAPVFFPFGSSTAAVRARADGALLFELMGRDFPLQPHGAIVVEDLPSADPLRFGEVGRIWAGNRQGLREISEEARQAEVAETWPRLLEALRRDALLALSWRAQARGTTNRDQFNEARRLERSLKRSNAARQELTQVALEAAEQLFGRAPDRELRLADLLRAEAPAAAGSGAGLN